MFQVNLLFVQERKFKIDFQDGSNSGHLGFPIGTILAIFDLQVSLILPTKFKANWPFSLGVDFRNRFSRWQPWRTSWISNQNNFSYFWSTSTPVLPIKFRVNWPFLQEKLKIDFQDGSNGGHLGFLIRTILAGSCPDTSYQVSCWLAFAFRRRSSKYIFKMVAMAAILDFKSEWF